MLGVNESTLRNWIRRDLGEGSTPPAGGEAASEEIARLRRVDFRNVSECWETSRHGGVGPLHLAEDRQE